MTKDLYDIEKTILKDPNVKYYKLCGAGGGGYFLIMTEKDILNFTTESIKINIDNKGVKAWGV